MSASSKQGNQAWFKTEKVVVQDVRTRAHSTVNDPRPSDFKIQTTSRTDATNCKARRTGANDLALNVDHIFEADECDAFDSDVDEGPFTDHVHASRTSKTQSPMKRASYGLE
ncbi:hypothetical protein Tco_0206565 [Tanacetum coccineum]